MAKRRAGGAASPAIPANATQSRHFKFSRTEVIPLQKSKEMQSRAFGAPGRRYSLDKFRKDLGGWLLCLPALAILAFYSIWPLLGSIQLAFSKTKGYSIVSFSGLDNFKVVLNHPHFRTALANSGQYVFWSLLIGLLMPVLIAAITTEVTRGRGFFRIAMRMPGILPSIASLLVLTFFFRSDNQGVLNMLITRLGGNTVRFLTNRDMTIFWLIVSATWKGAGGTALLYMAAMTNISGDLYEAAALDGVSPWKRFLHITWPGIRGQFSLLLILQIISVFQILYEPLVMTNGGPNNASLSLMLLVYRYAFEDLQIGRASALSLIVSLFLIVLSIVRYLLQKRIEREENA